MLEDLEKTRKLDGEAYNADKSRINRAYEKGRDPEVVWIRDMIDSDCTEYELKYAFTNSPDGQYPEST